MRRPLAFRRLPRVGRWRPRSAGLCEAAADEYPGLRDDLLVLDKEVTPSFNRADDRALYYQNRYRLEQLTLVVGGTVSSILGLGQANLGRPLVVGLAVALVPLGMAWSTLRSARVDSQERTISERLAAEKLKREYFLFLGRVGDYGDDAIRLQRLRENVAAIEAEARHG